MLVLRLDRRVHLRGFEEPARPVERRDHAAGERGGRAGS